MSDQLFWLPNNNKPVLKSNFSAQFCHPDGFAGSWVGHIMGAINFIPNKRAIEALDVGATDDVLELGFGPGRALKTLARLAAKGSVTGIDQSATMLGQARARNRHAIASGRVRLLHSSFESIPLAEHSIDRILAVNVAYFISPLGNTLSEARRVLRPGGWVSIYVTDYSAMHAWQFAGPETCQMFDAAGFKTFLSNSAFAEDRIEIQRIALPLGFRGLIARICKTG